jgi:hypothetical protein
MSVRSFEDANIAIYRVVSAAAAYNLVLPFEADCIEWYNYTGYATDDTNIQGIWFKDYPAGDATIISRGTTDLSSVLETTNGVTQGSDGVGFADNHRIPTAITAASPAVVTSNGHGLSNGQFVRATNFRATPLADATGMYTLNNQLFEIGNVTTNTFALYIPNTNLSIPVDTTADTAFVNNGIALFTLTGESLNTQNPAPVFQYTLGTEVMGSASDVIFIRAMKGNVYQNLGNA